MRDGSEVARDPRTGDVLAEIILEGSSSNPASGGSSSSSKVPVLASYSSPWPLATGTVFDVECRDAATGDGAFLAVSPNTQGQSLAELKDSFFVNRLIDPTGRFSSYGEPTDVKVRKSTLSDDGKYRTIDLSFSTLSQSTQTEIPRRARIVATIPDGTQQAVMLVGSANALRWKKAGAEQTVHQVTDSFRAVAAPQTALRVRAKERRSSGGN